MLIKPRVPKVEVKPQPDSETFLIHPAYFGTISEIKDFLEEEGKLINFATMAREFSIRSNKIIHDRYNPFNCSYPWTLCNCKFARLVRMKDLYLDNVRLMEVI